MSAKSEGHASYNDALRTARVSLIVIRAQDLAGPRVDQMHAGAGGAGHSIKAIFIPLCGIVSDPTLHVETGDWASEKKCWHCSLRKSHLRIARRGSHCDARRLVEVPASAWLVTTNVAQPIERAV
jgi:hypothetical protein